MWGQLESLAGCQMQHDRCPWACCHDWTNYAVCNLDALIPPRAGSLAACRGFNTSILLSCPGFGGDLGNKQQVTAQPGLCNDNTTHKLLGAGAAVAEPRALSALISTCAHSLPTHEVLGSLAALKSLAEVRQRHALRDPAWWRCSMHPSWGAKSLHPSARLCRSNTQANQVTVGTCLYLLKRAL